MGENPLERWLPLAEGEEEPDIGPRLGEIPFPALSWVRGALAELAGPGGSPLFVHHSRRGRILKRGFRVYSTTPEGIPAFRALVQERFRPWEEPLSGTREGEGCGLRLDRCQLVPCKRFLRADLLYTVQDAGRPLHESLKILLMDAKGEIQVHSSGTLVTGFHVALCFLRRLAALAPQVSLGLETWALALSGLEELYRARAVRSWLQESEEVVRLGCTPCRLFLRYSVSGVDLEQAEEKFWFFSLGQQNRVVVEQDVAADIKHYREHHQQWLSAERETDESPQVEHTPADSSNEDEEEEEEEEEQPGGGLLSLWLRDWELANQQENQPGEQEQELSEEVEQPPENPPFDTTIDMHRTGETTVHTTAFREEDVIAVDVYVSSILVVLMHNPPAQVKWYQRQERRQQRQLYGMAQRDVDTFLDKLPTEHIPSPFVFDEE